MLPAKNKRKRFLPSHPFKYGFLLILSFFILFWFSLYSYHRYLQDKIQNQTAITSETGIDTLMSLNLGETEQWILIRGQNRNNPVLLVLHGGPGAPLFPFARALGWKTGLEEHFTMIYWEERGTGKSFHSSISPQTMNLEQFARDAVELIQFIRNYFHTPRIFLMAKSWGSLLGMKIIRQKPEWIYAYVAVGQMVTPLKSDSISYEYTIELALKQKDLEVQDELRKIGYPPYNYKQLLHQRKWLRRLSNRENLTNESFSDMQFVQYFKILLATPEYSVGDIIAMGSDPYFSLKYLWNEKLYQTNLIREMHTVNVPVYFICGRYDYITAASLVEEFYQNLAAPHGKSIIWFDKSGHQPEFDESRKFFNVLVNQIKPAAFQP